MSYADKVLTCRDCRQPFVFSAGEQEFYASRGFTNEPGRCPDCRAARRAERAGSLAGGSYSTGGYSTGAYSTGGYGSDAGFGRRERELFSVTCSACGNEARVPFQPRGDRPVYCSDCFARQRGSGTGYGSGRGYR